MKAKNLFKNYVVTYFENLKTEIYDSKLFVTLLIELKLWFDFMNIDEYKTKAFYSFINELFY